MKTTDNPRTARSLSLHVRRATGPDKPVAHRGRTVGVKKTLIFYHGKPTRGVKTKWIMHEYHLVADDVARKLKSAGTGRSG
jgi:hypothetical protein